MALPRLVAQTTYAELLDELSEQVTGVPQSDLIVTVGVASFPHDGGDLSRRGDRFDAAAGVAEAGADRFRRRPPLPARDKDSLVFRVFLP